MHEALAVVEDIKIEVNTLLIEEVGSVTLSMGVADNLGCDCVDSAIKKVDNLMYRAKSEGRN